MIKFISITSFVAVFILAPGINAQGVSVGIGMEYLPSAKIQFGNPSNYEAEFYDNLSFETGVYWNFPAGFRLGPIFNYYKKTVTTNASTPSDLSAWGLGVIGDFAFEITESGGTLIVTGFKSGYGQLSDDNEILSRSAGSIWISGLGGMRFRIASNYCIEADYLLGWSQYDLTGEPEKSFKFTGSKLSISLCYNIFNNGNEK
jgi:hypothetical protein